jgi:DNA invertase Pin-like site-specific DNA recombinase
VVNHTESRRRQYDLADAARAAGFVDVLTIDEDLGRSGSGLEVRPGFQKLVAAVCAGTVGTAYCIEASRLARNGRDWHHLIDLCALAGSLVVDPDGVYDPRLSNDRLLLGLKGTMSEYELSLLRQRGIEARDGKARRSELRFTFAGILLERGRAHRDRSRRACCRRNPHAVQQVPRIGQRPPSVLVAACRRSFASGRAAQPHHPRSFRTRQLTIR